MEVPGELTEVFRPEITASDEEDRFLIWDLSSFSLHDFEVDDLLLRLYNVNKSGTPSFNRFELVEE